MSALESRFATVLQRLFSIRNADAFFDLGFALGRTNTDDSASSAVDSNGRAVDSVTRPAAGRPIRTDGGRNRRDQPSDGRADGADVDAVTVEFLDRETVRIVGDLEDVLLSLFWWDDSGLVGTITEPIGGVDGERIVAASEAFADQEFAYGPIVTGVEGFETAGPSVPGTGDVSASNPDLEAHVEAVREAYDGSGELEEPFSDAS